MSRFIFVEEPILRQALVGVEIAITELRRQSEYGIDYGAAYSDVGQAQDIADDLSLAYDEIMLAIDSR
jgi:hypothetical protein